MKLTNVLDLQKNSLQNAVAHPVGVDPASPSDGQFWYRTDTDALHIRSAGVTETVAFMTDVTAGSVAGTLWNAQSVLVAVADDTPLPVTVTINSFVGRGAGDVGVLTAAAALTVLGIEAGATADQTAAEILALLLTVDGPASGLDADSVDGIAGADIATETFVGTAISNLVASAPGALDTLNELAAALGDDPNFATTVTNALALRTQKYSATFGNGTLNTFTITHSLNTLNFTISVRESASGDGVIADWKPSGVNAVEITVTGAPPTAGFYTITVIG